MCNSNTQNVEADGPEAHHSQLHYKFKINLRCKRLCLKIKVLKKQESKREGGSREGGGLGEGGRQG